MHLVIPLSSEISTTRRPLDLLKEVDFVLKSRDGTELPGGAGMRVMKFAVFVSRASRAAVQALNTLEMIALVYGENADMPSICNVLVHGSAVGQLVPFVGQNGNLRLKQGKVRS
mmetsp:Transcript_4854/g.7065  ORF Transcript_4854/g.7065 Transcript_4854/m.7065 type:complete len:114 (-) Transcript_4854:85-426(-)